jgi:hypothetical protein
MRVIFSVASGAFVLVLGWFTTTHSLASNATNAARKHYDLVVEIITLLAVACLIVHALIEERDRNQTRKERATEKAERHETNRQVATLFHDRFDVSGSASGTQAPQTINAVGSVQLVWWPTRERLQEQVVDLIRNARAAAQALAVTPESEYMAKLIEISQEFTGPAVSIRQGVRNALGYPMAQPLNHLPIPSEPEDFKTTADVFARLQRNIRDDAPAAILEPS